MGLAGTDPGHVTECPTLDRGDRLERLGCVAEILQVPPEDTRSLDRGEHPGRLRRGSAERLGAQHGLARGRGCGHGLLVQLVGECHHHHVRVDVPDGRFHVRGVLGDAPPFTERLAAFRGPGVHHADTIRAALAVECLRVEVADEPGAEHRDGVMAHDNKYLLGRDAWMLAVACSPYSPRAPGADTRETPADRSVTRWRPTASAEDTPSRRHSAPQRGPSDH